MSHTKRNVCRCASVNFIIGFLILLFPLFILKNFFIAFCYLAVLTTLSTLNTLNVNKKMISFTFSAHFTTSDDSKDDKYVGKRLERKEFSMYKGLSILSFSIALYYTISVLFGAPVFEAYASTLYFSILMTLQTTYPLVWYFFYSDNLASVLKIISESKFDSLSENHLHSIIIWTVFGAWIGAFPIPLDWDRPWQTWPITCCIGSSLGYSAIHLIIGIKLFYGFHKDRRKVMNRSV